MKVSLASGPLAEVDADALVVSAFSKSSLGDSVAELDRAMNGVLSATLAEGAFKGNVFEMEWIYPAPGTKAKRVLLVGAGKAEEFDLRQLRHVAGAAARQARKKGAKRVCFAIQGPASLGEAGVIEAVADAVICALSDSDLYKSRADKGEIEAAMVWSGSSDAGAAQTGLERGQKIAAAVNFARWLGDEPANVMTPERVAEEARKMAEENGIKCEIMEEEAIRAAGMGSLLSVSQGSRNAPRVVILRYDGGGGGPILGLAGKGVTFDTGGISIKPAADMHYMKYDMCGSAAVIATVQALAQLGSKANVIAVAGMVENMPGSMATRPGDVVKAANGKTIEIINTDAEGRLVLADALDLAIKRGAQRLVDIATLTGAIKVALGDLTSGVMGAPQGWVDEVLAAADQMGERLWQMPLYKEYKDNLKSNIADMMNTGTRYGGACNAAAFLQQFVGDTPWAHLDIAGTAWTEKDRAWQMKGATGVMIRTLIELAESPKS